jgi:hypothetical protein
MREHKSGRITALIESNILHAFAHCSGRSNESIDSLSPRSFKIQTRDSEKRRISLPEPDREIFSSLSTRSSRFRCGRPSDFFGASASRHHQILTRPIFSTRVYCQERKERKKNGLLVIIEQYVLIFIISARFFSQPSGSVASSGRVGNPGNTNRDLVNRDPRRKSAPVGVKVARERSVEDRLKCLRHLSR